MSSNKTAVLFFSRTLKDEFKAKSFGLNRTGFSSLYKFFVNKTLQTVKDSGLPLIEVYSNEQVGDTFGERLTHALKTVAQQGFESVIVIGNDAPELSASDIQKAGMALQKGYSVLGRDDRGGVYLLGVDLSEAHAIDFESIRWHSDSVHHQLSGLLNNVIDLKTRLDLNTYEDVNFLLRFKSTLNRGVRLFLRNIFYHTTGTIRAYLGFNPFAVTVRVVRGPPQFAF
ncbi:DUF2064 domain-containing protein [Roseivirga sp. E12]|uniref:TIGR04282 family arsenosugar biosynthesis glycosyltransferase n=1 Tax=Roseivirga sp. E12 TaxID=2819237 RepID=UPI001ABC928D|nr:DUF2064 domain-containing protein [Roseivirga sp. E12]MBO3698302.1 DUF2064 domain-containing protein [Roseivirga sp. E12]